MEEDNRNRILADAILREGYSTESVRRAMAIVGYESAGGEEDSKQRAEAALKVLALHNFGPWRIF